jgi:hypothetical protein
MKSIITITLALIIFAATSCKENIAENTQSLKINSTEINAIKYSVGDIWKYQILTYNLKNSGIIDFCDTICYKVESEAYFNQDTVKIISSTDLLNTWTNYNYYIIRNNGVYNLPSENEIKDSYMLYQFPSEVGNTFIGKNMNEVIVESTDADFITASGIIKCYKFVERYNFNSNTKEITYFSPKIGLICQELYFKIGSDFKLVLKKKLIESNIGINS